MIEHFFKIILNERSFISITILIFKTFILFKYLENQNQKLISKISKLI